MVDEVIEQLVANRTLHELQIKRKAFEYLADYKKFVETIHVFERRLQLYFVRYCQLNELNDLEKTVRISVKGYYVENQAFDLMEDEETLLIIYTELVPATNRDSVLGLYNWEDKLNELRTSFSADGL